jgi:hypothetical protein
MRCTAPVRGHRSAAAAAACPACRGRSSYSSYRPSYAPPPPRSSYSSYGSSGAGSTRSTRTRRSGRTTVLAYTDAEWRAAKPVFEAVEEDVQKHPERRDVFLCHAWDDRAGAAKELHDLLEARGVSVWFSEKDIPLGKAMMREIDRGLRMSHIGIVLATPALLRRLDAEGVADKELSALLATDRLIPIAHGTTMETVRDHSPLLASRAGLTSDGSLAEIAARIADAVSI